MLSVEICCVTVKSFCRTIFAGLVSSFSQTLNGPGFLQRDVVTSESERGSKPERRAGEGAGLMWRCKRNGRALQEQPVTERASER